MHFSVPVLVGERRCNQLQGANVGDDSDECANLQNWDNDIHSFVMDAQHTSSHTVSISFLLLLATTGFPVLHTCDG
jgi:hypothetical protein